MKKYSTLILKFAIIIIGTIVLTLSIFGLVAYIKEGPFNPRYDQILYPIFISVYLSTIPLYIVLYKGFVILNNIDYNMTFTNKTLSGLEVMKKCSLIITVIYGLILPFIYIVADMADAPGFIIIMMLVMFVSFVFAVFFTLLQRVVQDAKAAINKD
jgi:hypothetical protein